MITFFILDYQLIMAANYLDIEYLLDDACKAVALSIKGKTVSQIREKLKIKNDLTEAEQEKIYRENKWCEDRSKK